MALMIHQHARQRLEALQQTARTPEDLRLELEQLLAVYPDFMPALGALAGIAEQAGDFPRALNCWQKILTANPRDCQAWVRMARLKRERFNEIESAKEIVRKVLTIDPLDKGALVFLSELCRRPDPAGAVSSQPLVSAIVSTCKSARFMRECLEDLERQSIADLLEIIVVDSQSPEDERSVVEEFQRRFSNIAYIRTRERETIYGAWNRGIRAARGKYITSANTDDRHRADALEILARTLDAHPEVTLVYADCVITTVENETLETTRSRRRFQWLEFNASDLLIRGCFCGPQPMWRREAHEEHGYFDADMVSAGDYEFWLRLAQNRKFLHVQETLGLYLESSASVEHANRKNGGREVKAARDRYRGSILDGKPPFRPKLAESKATVEVMIGAGTKPAPAPAQVAPKALPAVAKIGRLDEAREMLGRKEFSAAWAAAAAAIACRPFHPEAFLLLAEIAVAAGDGKMAKQCAQRALAIAPNWNAPKQLLRNPLKGNAQLEWLVLPDQIRNRKSEIGNRLSVCLIVKNEEHFLAQCLKSIQGLAEQIVVVDTGSTDRTVEIAKELGAEVHHFAWCDDFSAARNAALEHATGDWVLMLDADEELPAGQHARLHADMKHADVIAIRLPLVDQGREAHGQHCVPRLFRNAPGVYFYSRVHEQVFPSLVRCGRVWGLRTAIGTAELLHHGYASEVIKDRDKVERNLRLLRLAVEEYPDDANLQMNLGLELVHIGDLQTGLTHYREAFRLMSAQPPADVTPELREVLLTQFTCHLYKVRAQDEIVQTLNSPLAMQGGLTASLHFALGLAFFELKRFNEAAGQMRQCLAKKKQRSAAPINTDILTAVPHHCLAVSLMKQGDSTGAEKAFKAGLVECAPLEKLKLDYAKLLRDENRPVDALHQLHEVVSANSRNVAAWRLGGEIALSRPEFLVFAGDWTREAFQAAPENPVIAAQRAEALVLGGHAAEAAGLWKDLWSSEPQPRSLAALILCELTGPATTHMPGNGRDEQAASLAFIEWYRKLISVHAQGFIAQINGQLDRLAAALPLAAQMLSSALAEAGAPKPGGIPENDCAIV